MATKDFNLGDKVFRIYHNGGTSSKFWGLGSDEDNQKPVKVLAVDIEDGIEVVYYRHPRIKFLDSHPTDCVFLSREEAVKEVIRRNEELSVKLAKEIDMLKAQLTA